MSPVPSGKKAILHASSGPRSAIDFWRLRQRQLQIITDQLKSRERQCVVGLLISQQSKLLRKWRSVDIAITDAANDAKDINRLLNHLDPFVEAIHSDSIENVQQTLPLLNAIGVKFQALITRSSQVSVFISRFIRLCSHQLASMCCSVRNILMLTHVEQLQRTRVSKFIPCDPFISW